MYTLNTLFSYKVYIVQYESILGQMAYQVKELSANLAISI